MTVDILVPAYGPALALAELVESVLAQSDPAWRLTIIDDAYPDEALPGWAAGLCDARIKYVRNSANLGLTRNFAHSLSFVSQELVTLLGSDDLLLPAYVETVRAAHARHPRAAMIQPGVEVIDEEGRQHAGLADLAKKYLYAPRSTGETVLGGEPLAASLLRGNWLYFPSLCWRADLLTEVGFSSDLHTVLDLATELAMVEAGETLVATPTVCFRYRRHRSSVSSWRAADGSRFLEERAFFRSTAARMRARGWRRAERAARRHLSSRLNALSLVPAALRGGSLRGARLLLRHALGSAE